MCLIPSRPNWPSSHRKFYFPVKLGWFSEMTTWQFILTKSETASVLCVSLRKVLGLLILKRLSRSKGWFLSFITKNWLMGRQSLWRMGLRSNLKMCARMCLRLSVLRSSSCQMRLTFQIFYKTLKSHHFLNWHSKARTLTLCRCTTLFQKRRWPTLSTLL